MYAHVCGFKSHIMLKIALVALSKMSSMNLPSISVHVCIFFKGFLSTLPCVEVFTKEALLAAIEE